MKTISVIYAKVRHRLNDDWAYGNGTIISRKIRRSITNDNEKYEFSFN